MYSGIMTPKQSFFVVEYAIDQNGTAAARRAGYKGSDAVLATQAMRLLRNAEIKAEIDALLQKQKNRLEQQVEAKIMSKEQWVARVAAIADANIMEAFHKNENGKMVMTIEHLKTSPLGKLIRKLRVLPGGKVEFDIHPVLPALELLGKTMGWVKDQVEHSGEIATTSKLLTEQEVKDVFKDPELAALLLQVAKKTEKSEKGGSNG